MQDKQEQIFLAFQKRTRQRIAATVIIIIGTIMLGIVAQWDLSNSWTSWLWIGLSLAVLVGGGVFHWKVWRCPSCEVGLGRDTHIRHCPSCGTRLQP